MILEDFDNINDVINFTADNLLSAKKVIDDTIIFLTLNPDVDLSQELKLKLRMAIIILTYYKIINKNLERK